MNFQRFFAPTSRQALAKARLVFGEGTLVLANRPTPDGVEVIASAGATPAVTTPPQTQPSLQNPQQAGRKADMSTLSFQDFVRDRLLQKQDFSDKPVPPDHHASPQAVPLPEPVPLQLAVPEPHTWPELRNELNSIRALIEERFNTLTWLGQTRSNALHSNWIHKLIRAGFSADLSRLVLEQLPKDSDLQQSMHWVMHELQRQLKTPSHSLLAQGGIYALLGASGAGKTTTTAKLAEQCVRTYGAAQVGLISLDNVRAGAHEQLSSQGRTLGLVAHTAGDRAALQDLLGLLSGKAIVLIDTPALAAADPRTPKMLDLIDLPKVQRLLVLDATSQTESLDQVVNSFKCDSEQQVVLTKIDQAAKLGPVLDVCIRHQLLLRGIGTGQHLSEAWEIADGEKLLRLAMQASPPSVTEPRIDDLGFYYAQSKSLVQASQGA